MLMRVCSIALALVVCIAWPVAAQDSAAQDSAGAENSCQVSSAQDSKNGLPVRVKVERTVLLRSGEVHLVIGGTKGCATVHEGGLIVVELPVVTRGGVATVQFHFAPNELTGAN